jgi:hypothetical protein
VLPIHSGKSESLFRRITALSAQTEYRIQRMAGFINERLDFIRNPTGWNMDWTNQKVINKIHLPALHGINAGRCFIFCFK